jgi:hypothetical protein
MSNFLDLRCPECGDQHRIDILAELWVRVTDDGTDADASGYGDHYYTPESATLCARCGHCDKLKYFHLDDEVAS